MSDDPTYPCAQCGVMRTKAEGGTTFTVCDDCWAVGSPKPTVSDFDVGAEAAELLRWVRCAAPAHTSIEPRPEVVQVLLRAIAHGRRQGAEEMRERAAAACGSYQLRRLPRLAHRTEHAHGAAAAAVALAREILALPLPGDETEEP